MNIEQALSELRKYCDSKGYWPSRSEWNSYAKENNIYSVGRITYYVKKNWSSLMEEMGYKEKIKKYTEEECIEALKKASEQLGVLFTRKEYIEWYKEQDMDNIPSYAQISVKLGSWNKAKLQAGLVTNRSWGKEYDLNEVKEALEECAKEYGPLFSENNYLEWRKNNPDAPHIETIRRYFKSLPKGKTEMHLDTYEVGPQYKYTENRWREPFLNFLAYALNKDRYMKWAEENKGPSMSALWDNAGGYEKALLETLPIYMEKIRLGRKKR